MKYGQVDKRKPRQHMNLENLDRALQELGMLSAVTEARREFLHEAQSDYCMMRLNTRYVSNVTVGYCMRRTTTKNRLCPYILPARHRTKSENSDALPGDADARDFKHHPLEPTASTSGPPAPSTPAKRCQSLENLNLSDSAASCDPSQDMDCVSNRIQKLQVDE
ncbi:unnamed protein product [Plutella xylostella]|uniref:(diamondback moth) hypothetical protein n=1 Tax=Plutella xylostella TaxID=51655 RepID=A0A8S4FPJ7_PLUXY|nr:unnamed protein product [Plutella xylostella]